MLVYAKADAHYFLFTLNIHLSFLGSVWVYVGVFIFIAVSRRLPLILDVSPDGIDSFKSR